MSLCALYVVHLHSGVALATLLAIGGLLFLEHRLSEDVDLAFFKINAVLGFGILGFIATGVARHYVLGGSANDTVAERNIK